MKKENNETTKRKYYRAYEHPATEPAPSGEKEEPVYQMQINAKGREVLVEIGKTNIYNIIQESLEPSKIENIIRRATEGDPFALQQMNGQYIDTTDLPTTLAEAQNFVIKAKAEFEQLPINIRRMFNMSAEQYIASYGTSDWMDNMGINRTEETNAPINTTTTTTEGAES